MTSPVVCKDSVAMLMDYLEGTLAPADREAIEAHVAGCPRCVAFIESYRQTMLYGYAPPWDLLLPAAAAAIVWLVGGFVVFKKLEPGIADVA